MKPAAKPKPASQAEAKKGSAGDLSLKTEDPEDRDAVEEAAHSPLKHLSGPKIKVDTDAYSHHIE